MSPGRQVPPSLQPVQQVVPRQTPLPSMQVPVRGVFVQVPPSQLSSVHSLLSSQCEASVQPTQEPPSHMPVSSVHDRQAPPPVPQALALVPGSHVPD